MTGKIFARRHMTRVRWRERLEMKLKMDFEKREREKEGRERKRDKGKDWDTLKGINSQKLGEGDIDGEVGRD